MTDRAGGDHSAPQTLWLDLGVLLLKGKNERKRKKGREVKEIYRVLLSNGGKIGKEKKKGQRKGRRKE